MLQRAEGKTAGVLGCGAIFEGACAFAGSEPAMADARPMWNYPYIGHPGPTAVPRTAYSQFVADEIGIIEKITVRTSGDTDRTRQARTGGPTSRLPSLGRSFRMSACSKVLRTKLKERTPGADELEALGR